MTVLRTRTVSRALGARLLWVVSLAWLALCAPGVAWAHAPHDEIRAIALSPAFPVDRVVFAIARDVLMHSLDGGLSWHALAAGCGRWPLSALALSPSFATDGTVFAGDVAGVVHVSHNGGRTWTSARAARDGEAIVDLVALESSGCVFALASSGALAIAPDRGCRWDSVDDAPARTRALAGGMGTLFVGTAAGEVGALQVSGRRWRALTAQPLPRAITSLHAERTRGGGERLLVGTDGGGVFRLEPNRPGAERCGLGGARVTALASNADDTLFACTWSSALHVSLDGGQTWTLRDRGLTHDSQADEPLHRRPHFQRVAPSPNFGRDLTLFVGGFDGLFRSVDGGATWSELHDVLPAELIVGLATGPGAQLAVATYVGGAYLRGSGTCTGWRSAPTTRGVRLFDVAYSPAFARDRTVFATANLALLRSVDGGAHWQRLPLVATSAERARGFPQRAGARLLRLGMRAAAAVPAARLKGRLVTLLARRGLAPALPGYASTLALSPEFERDATLFVGGAAGRVLRSRDGGAHFSMVLATRGISAVRLSPAYARDGTVFAAAADALWISRDGGDTWTMLPGLPWRSAARLELSPTYERDGTLFAATDDGLFRSRDRGASWEPLMLAGCRESYAIAALAISPDFAHDGMVLAYARGFGLRILRGPGAALEPAAPELEPSETAFAHFASFPDRARLICFSEQFTLDRTIYAASMRRVHVSYDAGRTWEVLCRPVRIAARDRRVARAGSWRNGDTGALWSRRSGDRITLQFVGNEVSWLGPRSSQLGRAAVWIDDKLAASVDQREPDGASSDACFTARDLALGAHTISIEALGGAGRRGASAQTAVYGFEWWT